jgi:hypothetical protein
MKFQCSGVNKKVGFGSFDGFNDLDEAEMCAPSVDSTANKIALIVQSTLEMGKS